MGKFFLILIVSLIVGVSPIGETGLFSETAYARDPDVLPRDYEYGEHQTVGGSKWDGGDTFIAIMFPVAVVMLIALPHIFDGKDLAWPAMSRHRSLTDFRSLQVGRIASWDALGSSSGSRVIPKQALFPTVVTSSPIPLLNGWVLSFNRHRKSGYPPYYKFPTRSL